MGKALFFSGCDKELKQDRLQIGCKCLKSFNRGFFGGSDLLSDQKGGFQSKASLTQSFFLGGWVVLGTWDYMGHILGVKNYVFEKCSVFRICPHLNFQFYLAWQNDFMGDVLRNLGPPVFLLLDERSFCGVSVNPNILFGWKVT